MNSTGSSTSTGIKRLSGMYDLRIPPKLEVLRLIRTMLPDPKLRVTSCADSICEDPALILPFLKVAGSMEYSAGKPAVTNMKEALDRLGAQVAISTLDELQDIPPADHERVAHWLEYYRERCVRSGGVARILASKLAPGETQDCQVAGNLLFAGDMLAVLYFGETYSKLADELPRAKLLYKLEKEHQFDVETNGIAYLRKYGLPEPVLFLVDEKSQTKLPARAVLRPLIGSAKEFVLAYDADKWDKYAPGQTIPPKSPIRLLNLNPAAYTSLYGELTEYLSSRAKAT